MASGLTMKKLAGVALALGLMQGAVRADDDAATPTFYKDIAPLFQQACQNCHRPSGVDMGGMVAPMSLMSYEEVRPWAKSIVKSVNSGYMPPWHAAPEFSGVFANQRSLTADQVATIVRWAESGAAEGNPADAPAPMVFPATGWGIGEPDLVLDMPEPYFVKDDVEDQYINFTATLSEAQLPEDRWIKGIEFKAGGPVVHHIIGYAVAPGERSGGDGDRGMIGGIAPGNEPDIFPEGYGILLKKGTRIVFAMHYHKEAGPGTGVWDQSKVAFTFHDKPVHHALHIDAIGNHDFEIPPGHPNWMVGAARVFEKDTTILELMPHMHLRGKNAKYVAFYPDGTQETLLHVPKYDFNWQTAYEFKTAKVIPAGTRIEVTMGFDNSTENAANPDPAKSIRFGGPTTDEMMLGWLTYTTNDEALDREVGSAPATGSGAE